MIYDGIFFINSALTPNGLSIYNEEERFQQTIETLKSIDKYCPSNFKILYDTSTDIPETKHLQELSHMGCKVLYMGQSEEVKQFGQLGLKSLNETVAFINLLNHFKQNPVEGKRIYKMTGRYVLNEHFKLGLEHKDAFVFTKAVPTWMDEERQKQTGVSMVYQTRLCHMDYSLLDTFMKELVIIVNDCAKNYMDIEHSYYKNLHKYKVVEVERMGLNGNLAPNGEYIDD
jgi:hypothetical protein